MKDNDEPLRDAIREAADKVREVTGSSAWQLFEEFNPGHSVVSTTACRALGVIEGAAIALALTPIELLDECGISDSA